MRELDGFRVKGPKAQTLETTGARVESRGRAVQVRRRWSCS